jgi:hypothetical protein
MKIAGAATIRQARLIARIRSTDFMHHHFECGEPLKNFVFALSFKRSVRSMTEWQALSLASCAIKETNT